MGNLDNGAAASGGTDANVAAYLSRIGFAGPIAHDLATLTALQLAHLQAVPFEALDVFAGRPVSADDTAAWNKVVDRRRGGWCFEVNGAFAQLLEQLGFQVTRLGAAVLLGGPSVVIDHLVLEVMLDQPYLVEVGFGDQSPITPLPLTQAGPIESLSGTFEFLDSPQGTTLAEHVDGVPAARYRFKRVGHRLSDFEPASQRLSLDRSLSWSTSPFATRLLDADGTRITLSRRGLKVVPPRPSGRATERVSVSPEDWNDVLRERFGIDESFTPAQLAHGETAD